jgi:hypothetical protein
MIGCMVMIEAPQEGVDGVNGVDCADPVVAWADPFVQLAFVNAAVTDLMHADVGSLGDGWFARYVKSLDEVRARVDALVVDAAGECERRGYDRRDGFFTSTSWITHHVGVPRVEARARMQVSRLFELLPCWSNAAHAGEVGVEQTRLMARVAANPRIHVALIEVAERSLCDAIVSPFDVFERLVRNFALLADPDGANGDAEGHHVDRDVTVRQKPGGEWVLSGRFGSLQGGEFNEIFAHFVHAEWATDWAEAGECLGDDADITIDDLCRTEPQRRADALCAALLAAAQAPDDGAGPLPMLNVLIDETTLEETVTGVVADPGRYRNMVCRTQSGAQLDLSEGASLGLWALVRRVVHDGAGVVIDLGRRQRLFTGSARDAALLLADRCSWPGCDRHIRFCQVDHCVGWRAHGASVFRNGGPMCGPHNRLKHRGNYTTHRDRSGHWTIRDADGNPIG